MYFYTILSTPYFIDMKTRTAQPATILLIILTILITLPGCQKDEEPTPDQKATIQVFNWENETFKIYINDSLAAEIPAIDYKNFKVPAGAYKIEAKEKNYIINQDVYETFTILEPGQFYCFDFGN